MGLTESTMPGLGTPAPEFELPDAMSGHTITLREFAGKKGLLVMFLCPHCPFVKHIQPGLAALAKDYSDSPLGMLAISSNDVAQYPEDGPDGLRQMGLALGFDFPYCFDESQETAKAFGAACTPDFFLFDDSRRLVYRGQLDGSRPGNSAPVDGSDLRAAIEALLSDRPGNAEQKPSIGCNIKWKPGHEPAYAR
jgi:thiol-disulfide isomerase/thioredoxin